MIRYTTNLHLTTIFAVAALFVTSACTTSFDLYHAEGVKRLEQGRFAAARGLFEEAHAMVPENADNLCDLAYCHVGTARDYLVREDRRAAVRELNHAITYYDRALRSYPGYDKAITGMNEALELRGLFAEALQTAEWASRIVGPSAKRQLYLAKEYAERGDADKALLTYKQAVAMEPANSTPYWALGMFYMQLNRREEGIANIQQAYRLDPTQTAIAEQLKRLGAEVPDVSAINTSG